MHMGVRRHYIYIYTGSLAVRIHIKEALYYLLSHKLCRSFFAQTICMCYCLIPCLKNGYDDKTHTAVYLCDQRLTMPKNINLHVSLQ